jgi:hypothetical protein
MDEDSDDDIPFINIEEKQFEMAMALSSEKTKRLTYMLEIRKLDYEIKKLECNFQDT